MQQTIPHPTSKQRRAYEAKPTGARLVFLYVLLCSNGALYTGMTYDVARRMRQHNGSLAGGAKYTRAHRPVKLVALWESEASWAEVMGFERELKAQARKDKAVLLKNFWEKPDLPWGVCRTTRHALLERPPIDVGTVGRRSHRSVTVDEPMSSPSADPRTAQSIAPITTSQEPRKN